MSDFSGKRFSKKQAFPLPAKRTVWISSSCKNIRFEKRDVSFDRIFIWINILTKEQHISAERTEVFAFDVSDIFMRSITDNERASIYDT